MTSPSELHNELAPKIVADIIRPMYRQNMTPTQALVLLESVVTGVFLGIVKLGGDEPVIDKLAENVKLRLAESRLRNIKPAGEA